MRFVILFRERRRRKGGESAIPVLDSRFRGNDDRMGASSMECSSKQQPLFPLSSLSLQCVELGP